MRRVYLDQNKWIDLSRALAGDTKGAQFVDAGRAIAASVKAGTASFPLSAAHVLELWKKRLTGPRRQLASTMSAISNNDAIAPPWVLLPPELDRALGGRFGHPETPLLLKPFGRGMRHRGGASAPGLPAEIRDYVREHNPGISDDEIADWMDDVLLAGPAKDLPTVEIPQPPLKPAEDFAAGENEQVQRFREHGADKETRRRAVTLRSLSDIREPIEEALARAGLAWSHLEALGAGGLTDFMLELPSRAAGLELNWLQHDNTETKWHANDLTDIAYLSVAVGYCDIVVTERKWTALLGRCAAPGRFNTTVISDLAELPDRLAVASATP